MVPFLNYRKEGGVFEGTTLGHVFCGGERLRSSFRFIFLTNVCNRDYFVTVKVIFLQISDGLRPRLVEVLT